MFILGGQHIGKAVARQLASQGVRVKLIERDYELCRELAEDLTGIVVLNAAGTDIDTLKHEGVSDCDAFVAVTGNEEANILCSLLAKSHGAKRAIALVDRHEYVTLAPSLGVDACISPRLATAGAILKLVRPAGVAAMATIEQSNAEILEIVVPAHSPLVGRPLKDMDVPTGSIIGVIVRRDDVVIPGGDDRLEPNDHVVVFALPEAITPVERFFS